MKFITLIQCLAASLLVVVGRAETRPNVVLLLADDLGYGELGCQGNPQIPTPHIDSIARNGIRFTQAYVTAPNCSPSRAGLLTGRIPMRFGYEFNPIGARNEDPGTGLPARETTLAEMLKDHGYVTGLVGKWHLGGTADFHPRRHGFDEFFGFLHEGHFYVPPPWKGVISMLRRRVLPDGAREGRWGAGDVYYSAHMGHDEPPYDANNPILRDGQPVVEHTYLTDALTREAVDFIARHRDQPFFLYLAYNAVHSPLQGARRFTDRFQHIEDLQRRIFAAMLANLDESVGAILEALRREELDKRTVVIFLSDNGGPTRELTSSNLPLRGGKGEMYEGGLRVPMLIQWLGRWPAGRVEDRMVASVDLWPTLATLAGAEPDSRLDGVSLLPWLEGDSPGTPHERFFWRQGPRRALRQGPWKLVHPGGRHEWELYHLEQDFGEATNLAEREPDKLRELVAMWEEWNTEMQAPAF